MSWWPAWLPTEALGTVLGGLLVYASRKFTERARHRRAHEAIEAPGNGQTRVEMNKTIGMLLDRISRLEERESTWSKEYQECRREYLQQSAKVIRLEARVSRMQQEIDECHRFHQRPELE